MMCRSSCATAVSVAVVVLLCSAASCVVNGVADYNYDIDNGMLPWSHSVKNLHRKRLSGFLYDRQPRLIWVEVCLLENEVRGHGQFRRDGEQNRRLQGGSKVHN